MNEHNPQQGTSGRRHRVLFIAPTSFFADYGCHVRILEEARVLQSLGHHVTIATYRNGRDLPELTIERTLPIPWRRDYEVGSSRHKIAFDALLGLKTMALLVRRRFDVIHAHLHEGALIGVVLGKLAGLPVVFDFQGSLTEEMIDHNFLADGYVYRPLRRRALDRSPSRRNLHVVGQRSPTPAR
ncbi:MAG: glycosyltransferase [Caldilineaceae bacterium]